MPWFKMQCGEWKSSARTFKKLVLSQLKSENHHNEEKAWWWWQSCVITYFGCMCCCISDDACMALLSVPRLGVVVVQLLVGLWFLWCRMRSRRLSSSHQTDNRPRQSRPGKHHQYMWSVSRRRRLSTCFACATEKLLQETEWIKEMNQEITYLEE